MGRRALDGVAAQVPLLRAVNAYVAAAMIAYDVFAVRRYRHACVLRDVGERDGLVAVFLPV